MRYHVPCQCFEKPYDGHSRCLRPRKRIARSAVSGTPGREARGARRRGRHRRRRLGRARATWFPVRSIRLVTAASAWPWLLPPTNRRSCWYARSIAHLHVRKGGRRTVTFVPASGVALSDAIRSLPGVQEFAAAHARGEDLVVGTLDKLGDAFTQGKLDPFDVLLIDESYQANSAKYFAVAGLAPVHLLVGDGGQISPFATIEDPGRWRGLPEDPLQTAVGVVRRNHPTTPVYGLPITRRLDDRAALVASAVLPGPEAFAPGSASQGAGDAVPQSIVHRRSDSPARSGPEPGGPWRVGPCRVAARPRAAGGPRDDRSPCRPGAPAIRPRCGGSLRTSAEPGHSPERAGRGRGSAQ